MLAAANSALVKESHSQGHMLGLIERAFITTPSVIGELPTGPQSPPASLSKATFCLKVDQVPTASRHSKAASWRPSLGIPAAMASCLEGTGEAEMLESRQQRGPRVCKSVF